MRRCFANEGYASVGDAGGADDERLLSRDAGGKDALQRGVVAEVNAGIGLREPAEEVVARIGGGGDGGVRELCRAGDEGEAHTTTGAVDVKSERHI